MLKKLIIPLMLFAFIISAQTFAQGMRMTAGERAKQLSEQLKLNPTQTKKIEEIFTKQQDQMKKMFESGDLGSADNRNKIQKMREESNAEIMKTLTAKQKVEYKKILEEQRKRMEERMRNRGNQ
jgi:Spy/CpxP family protein refolding chaperone